MTIKYNFIQEEGQESTLDLFKMTYDFWPLSSWKRQREKERKEGGRVQMDVDAFIS